MLKKILYNYLTESNPNKDIWYHGTPDTRELEKIGGFEDRYVTVDYIDDLEKYKSMTNEMLIARENNQEKIYFQLLNEISKLKKTYKYISPIFLTDIYKVAKTYADPKRAFDYQNAVEKVHKVKIDDCEKIAKIVAVGDRFRFLNIDKVKTGFVNSGISEKEITELIEKFNYYIKDNKGIQTDKIAAIGNWLKFDCIDVIGVLDSYMGGNIQSTVRMVLKPSKIKLIK